MCVYEYYATCYVALIWMSWHIGSNYVLYGYVLQGWYCGHGLGMDHG